MIEAAIKFLLATQNADGGWGAGHGKQSNTEATALTVLALNSIRDSVLTKPVSDGVSWLKRQQREDGSWPLIDQVRAGSWVTAFAVLVLSTFESYRKEALQGAQWILTQKGRTATPEEARRLRETQETILDPTLEGWTWIPGAVGWVEPTAYALITLKKIAPLFPEIQAMGRIRQGELLIYDRMCKTGGWNYGNSVVLGRELTAYPDTTAVVLIALQDHQTNEANQRSLQVLREMLTHVQSGLALSWATLCFILYGRDVSQWRGFLASTYEKTGFLGEVKSVALALLASGEGSNAFRI